MKLPGADLGHPGVQFSVTIGQEGGELAVPRNRGRPFDALEIRQLREAGIGQRRSPEGGRSHQQPGARGGDAEKDSGRGQQRDHDDFGDGDALLSTFAVVHAIKSTIGKPTRAVKIAT